MFNEINFSFEDILITELKERKKESILKKCFVLDTNVLLHDPAALYAFKDNDVVIPLAILEELDHLKRFRDDMAKNARTVLQMIEGLKKNTGGDFNEGITLKEGGKVKIQLEIKTDYNPSFALSLNSIHYRILMSAMLLQDEGQQVVFVSKDLAMRIKAQAMGLVAEDYLNQRFSYDSIYRGFRKISIGKNQLDSFFKEGSLQIDEQLIHNEYCHLYVDEQNDALARFDRKKNCLISLHSQPENVWGLTPLNVEQRCALDLLLRDDVKLVTLLGPAGTGKTLLALAAGLKKVFDDTSYSRILVSRPIVPLGRDIGYLPGFKEEKLIHWMQPIYDNLEFLCGLGQGDSEETLKWVTDSKKLEMEAVTYIRGRSLPKIYMIIDEAQNLNPHEIKTIISRAGKGTKVILTGDPTQIDNPYLDKDSNGLTYVIGRFQSQPLFGHIFMEKTERSKLAAIAAEIM